MTNPKSHGAAAFTLTEILIALGIFCVGALGLLALFPVAQVTERESAEETRSAVIASGIMDALIIPNDPYQLRVARAVTNGLLEWKRIPSSVATNLFLSYNASGEPIGELDENKASLPILNMESCAVVTFGIRPKTSTPGLVTAEVTVASPAAAPSEKRSIRRFVRLLALP
jgi:hypothetical protein